MSNERYNGWLNYQTWNMALWIDNDQNLQEYFAERAEEILADNNGDRDDAASELATELEQYMDGMQAEMGRPTAGPFADLLTHALGLVDWQEIAEGFVSDAEYTPESEE